MRRRRDYKLPQDLKVWSQEYPDKKSAAHAAKLASRVIHSGKIHVRRNKVFVKTTFSADAWTMTFTTLATMLSKCNKQIPEWLWKYANECEGYSRKHKTWYLKNIYGKRMSCGEFMDLWKGIIPMYEEYKRRK